VAIGQYQVPPGTAPVHRSPPVANRDRKRRCSDQDYKHHQPYRDEGARMNGGHTVVAYVEFRCGSQSAFTQKRSESDLRPPYARQCERIAPPPDGNFQDDQPCALRRRGRVGRGVPNPTTRRLQLSVPHSTCQAGAPTRMAYTMNSALCGPVRASWCVLGCVEGSMRLV
jgi:hypothetical protein